MVIRYDRTNIFNLIIGRPDHKKNPGSGNTPPGSFKNSNTMKNFEQFLTKTTMNDKVDYLHVMYKQFLKAGRVKTFMSTARAALDAEWIHSTGIRNRYGTTFDKFITKGLFDLLSEHYIYTTFPPVSVLKFVMEITVKALQAKEEIIDKTVVYGNPIFYYITKHPIVTGKPERKPKTEKTVDVFAAIKEYFSHTSIKPFIKEQILEEMSKTIPTTTTINIANKQPVTLEKKLHAAFTDAIDMIITERQLFISGPAGTGKTTLGSQLAEALQLRFSFISCTAGMSEAHLLGRMDINGNYIQSSFIDLYENGGVFLFDEIDAGDANTLLIINSAISNGLVSVPNRKDKPVAVRHSDFYVVCAANTWGFGSNEYSGRNILDAAFLDRFVGSKLEVGYDKDLERQLSSTQPKVAEVIWKIRSNVQENKIRRVVSTRAIESGVRMLNNGKPISSFLSRFFTGWSEQEKLKALTNVNLN